MDFTKSEFQIFFSGVESDKYFGIVTKETNAVLMSYYYLRQQPKKKMKERYDSRPDLRILVDSGAHTFLQKEDKNPGEFKNKPEEFWDKYLQGYVDWARENKDHVFAVVELDLDSIVGQDKVEEWREKYFIPLEDEGIQVVYVWHPTQGEQEWEKMCKRFSFIGVSLQMDSTDMQRLVRQMNIAKRYGTRVHG